MAILADANGAGKHLKPLIEEIGAGYWIGVVSSLSLIRVLEGPLARGDEALAQRYIQTFENPHHWQVIPSDGTIAAAAVRHRTCHCHPVRCSGASHRPSGPGPD